MNAADFLQIISSDIWMFVLAVLISFIVFYPFYRYRIKGVLDPLLLSVIMGSFANIVPIVMYFTHNIKAEHFWYFVCSEVCFWGIYFIKTRNSDKLFSDNGTKSSVLNEYPLFFLLFMIYFLLTIYGYRINGIPIFNSSRFEENVDNSSGILGLLNRFCSMFSLFINMYLMHMVYLKRTKRAAVFIAIVLLFGILSGSKGFILKLVQAYFCYMVFFHALVPRLPKLVMGIIAISPIVTILLASYASGLGESFGYLGYRLIASGDVYWNGFGNAVVDNIRVGSPILNMTYFLWGPFRHLLGITVSEQLMTTVGSLVFEESSGFFPSGGAPNSRLSILSWIDFRWAGLFLSMSLGFFSSYLYRYCYRKKSSTIGGACVKYLLLSASLSFVSDVYLGFNAFFGIVPFLIIYYGYRLLKMVNTR